MCCGAVDGLLRFNFTGLTVPPKGKCCSDHGDSGNVGDFLALIRGIDLLILISWLD